MDSNPFIHSLLVIVAITIAFLTIMLLVAATVLAERRVLAFIQGRLGPNRVGYGGVLQPFAGILHDFVVRTGGANRYRRERTPIGMSQRFGLDSFETRSTV